MQKYQDVVLNQNGNPVSGVQVTVTDLLGTPVSVYSANAIGLNVNPLTSDNNGRFSFYAPDGRYNLSFSFGGNVVASITDILLEDTMDGSDAVFNDVTILGELSDASKVTSAPVGGLTATNVQAALAELDSEKIDASSLAATGGSALVGSDDGASGSLWTTVAGFIAFLLSSLGASVIGFIQAGTGAIQRSVHDKLRETVSVKDFGAVGDGVTDDTTDIQSCINAAPVGAEIDLCGLTYLVTGIDVTKQGVTLTNGKLITNAATARALIKVTADDVTIDAVDVYINGSAHASSCGAIGFDGASNGRVLGCKLDGAKRAGAVSVNSHQVAIFNGCNNIIVDGCTITNGVYTEHIYVDSSTNCRITNNTISNGSYSAVALVSAANTSGNHVVSNNTMHTFGTSIVTVDCDDCIVSGNVIYGSVAEQGINVAHSGATTANKAVVSNNTIRDCAGYGVGVTDSAGVVVSGNNISICENGVRVANTANLCAINGNTITETTKSGILFSVGDIAAHHTVKGNTLEGIGAHGIEAIGGTRYEVTGNTLVNVHNTAGGLSGGRMAFYWDGSTGTNKPDRLIYADNYVSNNSALVGPGPNRGIDIRNSIAALRVTASNNDYSAVVNEDFYTTGTAPTLDGSDFGFDYTPTLSANTGAWGALTVTKVRASRVGKLLYMQVSASATVASGSPAEFRLTYPNGWVGNNSSIYSPAYITVGGVAEMGICRQTGGNYFSFLRANGSAFSGAVAVNGSFVFEVA